LIPRSGDGTTLAAVLVTTPQARATPSSQQPPAPTPFATPLLAAARRSIRAYPAGLSVEAHLVATLPG